MKRNLTILFSSLLLLCSASALSWGWAPFAKDRISIKNCSSDKIVVTSYDNTDKLFSKHITRRFIAFGKKGTLKCRTKSCNLKVTKNSGGKTEKYHKKRGKYTITKDVKWKITKGYQKCNP